MYLSHGTKRRIARTLHWKQWAAEGMTALNELTLSALLWSAGNETIGVQIFSMQYEGNSTGAAALSVMSLAHLLVARRARPPS